MDLVENDQPVFILAKIEFGLGQLGAIGIRLKIEIDRRASFTNGKGKRRLANLTWTNQDDCRAAVQQFIEFGSYSTPYHPCIYGVPLQICKDEMASTGC
jgi:hypothetical protein